MPEYVSLQEVEPMKVVYAVNTTLRRIDERLVNHGERVAFIASTICKYGKFDLDIKTLFMLSFFHDIGAYKRINLDELLIFDVDNVEEHCIYGYLFMKHLTPLSKSAEAILYHHSSWENIKGKNLTYGEYAAMIHLADRMDVLFGAGKSNRQILGTLDEYKKIFKEDHLAAAEGCLMENILNADIVKSDFHNRNLEICKHFNPSALRTLEYLKMIVYSIDFRSDHTVTHSINTVAISINIARHFNLSQKEIDDIYIGSLLHDIGKVAIDLSILESPGRLSDDEMCIMRTHVEETGYIIKGVIPDEIYEISMSHHEKLDGSGYPRGLKGNDLTLSQRIVAVSDIVSALCSRRSYKEPFPKEKTLAIISAMSGTQLDSDVCNYVVNCYDSIMDETDVSRTKIIEKYQHIMNEYERLVKIVRNMKNDNKAG